MSKSQNSTNQAEEAANRKAMERRNAARFPIHGPVLVRVNQAGQQSQSFPSEIFDISLNGALLSKPNTQSLSKGDQVEVDLWLPSIPTVSARAVVVHSNDDRFGIEFNDMGDHDFDIFSGLVLMLEQKSRISFVS